MTDLIHDLERSDRRGRWSIAIAWLLSIALLASSWVGLFSFLAVNAAADSWVELDDKYLPEIDATSLVFPDLSRTSRVYAADGTLLAELHDGKASVPIQFEDIPDAMVYAMLAAEDKTFFEHEGINVGAIGKAFLDNLTSDSQRGGSTITQQVVKKHFVGDEISYERKIKEAITAIELERRYEKAQILEFYLNSIYLGWNAWGVQAAAEEYFNKDLSQLSVSEAAAIAVFARNPSFYDPRSNEDRVVARRDDVIREMLESDFITQEVADSATAAPLGVVPFTKEIGLFEHVVAEVKQQLLNSPEFDFLGATSDERKIRIFGCPADDVTCEGGGGLDIYTTIDVGLQQKATQLLREWVPTPDDPEVDAPTGAIASVDTATGAVLVMASGLDFEVEQFNIAVQGRRNPGSSFKPITLLAALEQGTSLTSLWNSTSPQNIECPYVCSSLGNIWRVNGGRAGPLITLDLATYLSVNVVYAQVAVQTGPENIVDAARRMGITSPLKAVPALALGGSAVTPLEMASAYTTFATNGLRPDSFLVASITSRDGRLDWDYQTFHQQVFDPALIAAARRPMIKVPNQGTGTNAKLDPSRPQAGKTGTHQDYTEAWFVGYVPQISTSVWIGFPDAQIEMKNITIHGKEYRTVTGGSVPALIWKDFMEYALADVPVLPFPPDPPGVSDYFKVPTTEVPDLSEFPDLTIEELEQLVLTNHLLFVAEETDSTEPEGTILEQDLEPGTEVRHGETLTVKISTGITPEYLLPGMAGLTISEIEGIFATFADEFGINLSYVIVNLETNRPERYGRLITTDPEPGSPVIDGQTITLFMGIPEA
jgi:membrane peptidoglycan carboxypeptidase